MMHKLCTLVMQTLLHPLQARASVNQMSWEFARARGSVIRFTQKLTCGAKCFRRLIYLTVAPSNLPRRSVNLAIRPLRIARANTESRTCNFRAMQRGQAGECGQCKDSLLAPTHSCFHLRETGPWKQVCNVQLVALLGSEPLPHYRASSTYFPVNKWEGGNRRCRRCWGTHGDRRHWEACLKWGKAGTKT